MRRDGTISSFLSDNVFKVSIKNKINYINV